VTLMETKITRRRNFSPDKLERNFDREREREREGERERERERERECKVSESIPFSGFLTIPLDNSRWTKCASRACHARESTNKLNYKNMAAATARWVGGGENEISFQYLRGSRIGEFLISSRAYP